MIKQQLQVKLFMQQFGQAVCESPQVTIDPKIANLRVSLGEEEQREFSDSFRLGADGMMHVDLKEALDGLCDRLYILLGDAHALGLSYLLPVAFRMVHESNMTKFWTYQEIQRLPEGYTAVDVDNGLSRCYRVTNSHGKVIKSPSYEPADLQGLLDEFEGQELLNYNQASKVMFGDDAEEQELQELSDQLGEEALANFTVPKFNLDDPDSDDDDTE